MTVEQYTARFHELASFVPRIVEDEEMKATYLEGLCCSIRQLIQDADECTMT